MWPNLFRSLALIAAPAAFAQEFISLTAERNWVLAGRSLSMQAIVEGEFGETLPDVAVSWASSNPAVARVGACIVPRRVPPVTSVAPDAVASRTHDSTRIASASRGIRRR